MVPRCFIDLKSMMLPLRYHIITISVLVAVVLPCPKYLEAETTDEEVEALLGITLADTAPGPVIKQYKVGIRGSSVKQASLRRRRYVKYYRMHAARHHPSQPPPPRHPTRRQTTRSDLLRRFTGTVLEDTWVSRSKSSGSHNHAYINTYTRTMARHARFPTTITHPSARSPSTC